MSASNKKKLRKEQASAALTEKQLQEQKEAKKLKNYTFTFVVVMILVVCIAVGTFATTLFNRSGIMQRSTIGVTIGEHELTNADLSFYYVEAISSAYSNWEEQYGDYVALFMQYSGLDLYSPLGEQTYDKETGDTWADYFIDIAIENAKSTYALYDCAIRDNHKLTEDEQKAVDSQISYMQLIAAYNGYSDMESYLKAYFGFGSNEENFKNYLNVTALATSYYNAHRDSLTYTETEMGEYEKDKKVEYNSYSYTYFYLPYSDFTAKTDSSSSDKDSDATSGTTKETTAEEKEAAQKAAREKALAEAKAAAEALAVEANNTEETLNAAIKKLDKYKDDKDAVSIVCKNYLYASAPEALREWLASEERTEGQIAVVPSTSTTKDADGKETTTTNGYYVVIFQGSTDNQTTMVNIRHILVDFDTIVSELVKETGKKTADYKDEDGNYIEEVQTKAKERAQKLLDEWKNGEKADAESFGELAKKNSDDTGSKSNGGLYEDVYPGQMLENFNDWCFAEGRKEGDTGLVETEHGWHVMYFDGFADQTFREAMIEADMITEDMKEWYDAILKDVKAVEKDLSKMDFDYTILSAY